jgi:hypothetical protein
MRVHSSAKMRSTYVNDNSWNILLTRFVLVALVCIGLLGAAVHQHASETDSIACPLCHAAAPPSLINLVALVVTPYIDVEGLVGAPQHVSVPAIVPRSLSIPRAPPDSIHLEF